MPSEALAKEGCSPCTTSTLSSCFARTALRRIVSSTCAKQDALRSFSQGGLLSMYYVYLIESTAFPGERYVGLTTDLKRRFRNHNDGESPTPLSSNLGALSPTSHFLIERKLKLSSDISSLAQATLSPAIDCGDQYDNCPVAQWTRAPRSGRGGRAFESRRDIQSIWKVVRGGAQPVSKTGPTAEVEGSTPSPSAAPAMKSTTYGGPQGGDITVAPTENPAPPRC